MNNMRTSLLNLVPKEPSEPGTPIINERRKSGSVTGKSKIFQNSDIDDGS